MKNLFRRYFLCLFQFIFFSLYPNKGCLRKQIHFFLQTNKRLDFIRRCCIIRYFIMFSDLYLLLHQRLKIVNQMKSNVQVSSIYIIDKNHYQTTLKKFVVCNKPLLFLCVILNKLVCVSLRVYVCSILFIQGKRRSDL